ncbi:MAG: YraN family protein [Bacteroidales bacterium]|nr:YraN family protein [Bacteroidales bacterium]
MNLQPTSKIGNKGEQMACDFLETRGHHILDRNWRGGHLEIDIVSEAPDGVHFIEVKARTAPVLAPLDRQVPPVKQKRICAAAQRYLHVHRMNGKEVYFDVVSVTFEGVQTMVKYYPQAWIPMYV